MKVYMKSHGKRLRKYTLESKHKMPRNPAKCYGTGDLFKNTRAHNWALGQSPLWPPLPSLQVAKLKQPPKKMSRLLGMSVLQYLSDST